MSKKLFAAQLATETNTFSPTPTGLAAFTQREFFRNNASIHAPEGCGAFLAALRQAAERDGFNMVESICAFAQPAGPTVHAAYLTLRNMILEDLRAAMPVSGVVLLLHGAMVSDSCDDCEGDLLACVREIVGPDVPVGACLDLHCHASERMFEAADVLVAFKEYPHTDVSERLLETYSLVSRSINGEIDPVMRHVDCKMIGLWPTTHPEMRKVVNHMHALEHAGAVLSVSLGHGFPWGDTQDTGAKAWAIADADEAAARRAAEDVTQLFWSKRDALTWQSDALDAAIEASRLAPSVGPVVIADIADNPGGGAPGDSTFLLSEMLKRALADVALGAIWDLGAVQHCLEAGEGAHMLLRLGGKSGKASGMPLDVSGTVMRIVDDHAQNALGARQDLGRSVWFRTDSGVDVLIASVRAQIFGRDAFEGIGISLVDKRLVVLKSTQHFYAEFAPLAHKIFYVGTAGALQPDFRSIQYTKRSPDYWPACEAH